MGSSQIFFLLCSIFLHLFAPTIAQLEVVFRLCMDKGNYTANSTYQANLHHLLNNVCTNTEIDYGFYNFSYGENSDKVYAIALCRPDIKQDICRDCVNFSSLALTSLCPDQKEAIIGFENCMLRYTNRNIFGLMEVRPSSSLYNLINISDVDGFNKSLYTLLDRLRDQAAAGDSRLKYAIGQIAAPNFQTIYALSQCTPDLSKSECSDCLYNASGVIPQCCHRRQGGRVILPSCNLRYEINRFYDLPAGEPPGPRSKGNSACRERIKSSLLLFQMFFLFFLTISVCILIRLRKPMEEVEHEATDGILSVVESLQYNFETIRLATDNFSEANKLGEGGFGAVYKGTFPNGQDIAVKRLSRDSTQGELEFKNEVHLVARLQHKNLVRLLGFCFELEERLLVYEFVPNSSLNNFIFDPLKRLQLDWESRYKIIGGIARGMVYLHKDSRLRIIHRDLKPSNILLDEEMNPKISDFGMARLFAADQTQDNTSRVVGTFGYMPPEYVKRGQFSIKSDVFSFGVLVLEIVCGRKRSFCNGEEVEDLLTNAWENWSQGKALSNLIDPTLRIGSRSDMVRCIHIGLLCVQENVVDRPTMASVVTMLDSQSLTLPVPQKPAFFFHSTILQETSLSLTESDQSKSVSAQHSKNEASISELYPR